MATFQKYKQGQANTVVGTQTTKNTFYGVTTNIHVLTINNSLPARGNLIAECDVTGGVVEAIVNEINPLAYFIGGVSSSNAGGNLFLVTDVTVEASDIQHRVRQIGANAAATRLTSTTFTYANTAVGPNQVDISGTQVLTGTTISVS
jgi:hypothetical protein